MKKSKRQPKHSLMPLAYIGPHVKQLNITLWTHINGIKVQKHGWEETLPSSEQKLPLGQQKREQGNWSEER